MKKFRHIIVMVFAVMMIHSSSHAQDPSFSQFFSSPLNINPALTGNINGDWRLMSNFRDEWIGPASPYVTGTISYDQKLMQKNIPNVAEDNILGIGGMLMFDNAMSGIVKSTYASLNLSYSVKLAEGEGFTHRLGLGFGATYGHRSIDYSRLDFEEQFTGTGFNTSLPTGENALSNMKAFVSANVGILYSYTTETSNFDLGVSAFHVNKPKQTFLKDANQDLAIRKVAHANFETFLNERLVLNANAIYQQQSTASYFSIGGALGYYLGDDAGTMLNAGTWYWSKNAIIPYVGITYKDYQFGLSYDVTTSKLNQAARKPATWEFSLIIRGKQKSSGVIPCPWK
jgi:type IX secretion system PorP/SprF family membrane protein